MVTATTITIHIQIVSNRHVNASTIRRNEWVNEWITKKKRRRKKQRTNDVQSTMEEWTYTDGIRKENMSRHSWCRTLQSIFYILKSNIHCYLILYQIKLTTNDKFVNVSQFFSSELIDSLHSRKNSTVKPIERSLEI